MNPASLKPKFVYFPCADCGAPRKVRNWPSHVSRAPGRRCLVCAAAHASAARAAGSTGGVVGGGTIDTFISTRRLAAHLRANITAQPWRQFAACLAPDVDPEAFDEENERIPEALAVCATCPVVASCLANALATDEPFLVAGAKTVAERQELRSASNRAAIA